MKTGLSRWSGFRRCASVMFATLGTMGGATEALAASVTVTTTTGGNPSTGCGLQEAVAALNAGVSQNGCTVSGTGINTVLLQTGSRTYTITNRLAPIGHMIFQGDGVSNTIIQASSGYPAGSLIFVDTPGAAGITVTLRDLTLRRNPSSPPPNVCGVELQGHWNDNSPTPGPTVNLERTRVTGFDRSGIRSIYGQVNVEYSTIEGNTSPDDGGGAYIFADGNSARGINIDNSLIYNNQTMWSGAGLYFYAGGSCHIRASTFAANNATWGGGGAIYAQPSNSSYLQLMHVTIADNSASTGGGIYSNYIVGDSRFSVFRSIIANNSGQSGADINGYVDDEFTLWSSTDENDLASHGVEPLLGVDPLLGGLMDLAGNGIRTYPLLKGSPAIDYTDQNGFFVTDQRGFPLQMNTKGGAAPRWSDIGAYEHGPWQTELLTMVAKSSSDTHSVFSNSSLSNGQGTLLQANQATDFVTYRFPVFETGSHAVKLGMYRTTGQGRAKLQWSNSQSGPWTDIGTEQDFYAASSGAVEVSLPSVNLTTIGQKYFRFLVTGKTAASSGYAIRIDYVKLIKS
jgi:hypothetical protein